MLGADPDVHASQVPGIIETNSVGIISFDTYRNAPLFHIFISEFGIISDTSATTAIEIYPILGGILYPIFTFLFIRHIIKTSPEAEWIGFAGSIVAAVGTVSTVLSYQPFPQLLSSMLWLVLIYLIITHIVTWTWRATVSIILVGTGMLYSHVLPLTFSIVVSIILCSAVILTRYLDSVNKYINIKISKTKLSKATMYSVFIFFILILLLSIQYFYATIYGPRVVNRFIGIFGPQTDAALYSGGGNFSMAEPIGTSLIHTIVNNLNVIAIIPTAAVSGLLLIVRILNGRTTATPVLVIMSAALAASIFMIPAIIAPVTTANIGRFLLITEPVLIAMIAIAFYRNAYVAKIIIMLLIISQLFSGFVISPDYPFNADNNFDSERAEVYISAQDISAKDHSNTYVRDTIHTDWTYARERTPNQINQYKPDSMSPEYSTFDDSAFLNGVLYKENYKFALVRNKTIFRTSDFGYQKIQWIPIRQFDRKYNKAYTNGETALYKKQIRSSVAFRE